METGRDGRFERHVNPSDAPAASLPEPRPAAERIVTVPESSAAPAFSAEAVAAAARVLSAARTAPAPSVPAETASSPAPVTVALPAVLGLPAGSRQVVLAVAS